MFRFLIIIFIGPLLTFGQSTSTLQKEEEAKIYSQVIAEYIKAVYKKDTSRFDTLFIGKHADFPDITLPATVQNTTIMLLTTEEADKKLDYRKSLVYINMVGWIEKDKSEFILVTFLVTKSNEKVSYMPKHNCLLDLNYNAKRQEFEFEKVKFENY